MEAVANQPEYDPNRPASSLELLDFKVSLFQDGDVTGSEMHLRASVTDNGEPAEQIKVSAKVLLPDGDTAHIDFEKVKPGHFKYVYKTTIDGDYEFHVHAKGVTNDGREYSAERTLSGAVYTDFT